MEAIFLDLASGRASSYVCAMRQRLNVEELLTGCVSRADPDAAVQWRHKLFAFHQWPGRLTRWAHPPCGE